jgi:predicted enzyme related to lactoylglutathione lyase
MPTPWNLVLYPVSDVEAAKAIYRTLLGVDPYADSPYYVGFKVDDRELGLVPNGHAQGMASAVPYVAVDDIKSALAALIEAGATEGQAITDVGGGMLVASVKDGDGNVTGLRQFPAA